MIYGDNFSDVDLSHLITFHRSHHDPVTMLLFRTPVPRACGIVALDTDARITAFTEKPAHPASNLANGGVYVMTSAAFCEMADMNGFDIAHDVLPAFVGRMRGWLHPGYHLDVGTFEAYQQANTDAPRINARRQIDSLGRRPAVFLDRDGVLIDHVPYLSDPAAVRLLPGAAQAVLRLRRAGYACVVVSNQSGVATWPDHRAATYRGERPHGCIVRGRGYGFRRRLLLPCRVGRVGQDSRGASGPQAWSGHAAASSAAVASRSEAVVDGGGRDQRHSRWPERGMPRKHSDPVNEDGVARDRSRRASFARCSSRGSCRSHSRQRTTGGATTA